MSYYTTDEPEGEEIVDIGTTSQDAALTIKYKRRNIGRSHLISDCFFLQSSRASFWTYNWTMLCLGCTVYKGSLDNISILMTVSSDSGKTYKIKRNPGGGMYQLMEFVRRAIWSKAKLYKGPSFKAKYSSS